MVEGVGAQSKERKGSNFAIWQPWAQGRGADQARLHDQQRQDRGRRREQAVPGRGRQGAEVRRHLRR